MNLKVNCCQAGPNEDVERVRRAHLNDMENILPFFCLAILYIFTEVIFMGSWCVTVLIVFVVFVGIFDGSRYLCVISFPKRNKKKCWMTVVLSQYTFPIPPMQHARKAALTIMKNLLSLLSPLPLCSSGVLSSHYPTERVKNYAAVFQLQIEVQYYPDGSNTLRCICRKRCIGVFSSRNKLAD